MGTSLELLSVITLCLLLGLVLFLTSSSDSKKDRIITKRRLYVQNSFEDPKTVQVKSAPPPIFDVSCPLAMPKYFDVENKDGAADALYMAQHSGAFETFQDAIQSGAFDDRRVVIVGDSTVRQTFSSMACHLYMAGLLFNPTSYVFGLYFMGHYFDARVKLKGGGELIYNPLAGHINNFWMLGVARDMTLRPMESTEDWIEDCKQRRPFSVDTYREYTQAEGPHFLQFTPDNPHLEKVMLTGHDIVFMNRGHHPNREENLTRTKALLECMDEQRANYKDWVVGLWPTIHYIRTTPPHFQTKTGVQGKLVRVKGCVDDIPEDYTLMEEQRMFTDKSLVAGDLDLGGIGRMHVSDVDCVHYAMPGVPSLFAQEIGRVVKHTPH